MVGPKEGASGLKGREFRKTGRFARTGKHSFVDQLERGSIQEINARAVRTAVANNYLRADIERSSEALLGKDGEFLDRLMDPPWMKPVAYMLANGVDMESFGQATLVVDLAGYSRLCQVLPADTLMVVMEKFHVAMFEISQKYGGQLVREPLGDATVHFFDDKSKALLAALEMQVKMQSFVDDAMRNDLLKCGYVTDGFKINVAVVDGGVTLEIRQMGEARHVVFMGGQAYETANNLLSRAERRGVVITEEGIVDPTGVEATGDEGTLLAAVPAPCSPETIIARVNLAVNLIRTTTLKPRDIVSLPDMAEVYTTIAALRLEDLQGRNVISDPTHAWHNDAMTLLDHFCWKYSEMQVCKSGDKGELIVMNRSSKDLIKMCYELREELSGRGMALQAGIFGGAFRAQSLYAELSEFGWDVHSPAFASAVRAANFNKGSGESHVMIERRIADEVQGLVVQKGSVMFRNMGEAALATLHDVTDEIDEPRDELVGRDVELATAEEFIAGGENSILFFSGDPGMGKNRLLGEVEKRARREGRITVSAGTDTKEYFVRDILLQLASQSFVFQWPDEMREQRLRQFIDSPARFTAMLAIHEIGLKVFIGEIDKLPMDTLQFLYTLTENARTENLQIIAGYNSSAHAEEVLTSAGFGKAVESATHLGPVSETIVRGLIERKIDRPLLDLEFEQLRIAGICVPHVLNCLLPALIPGVDIDALLGGKEQSKGQVVQDILDKMLAEKGVTSTEKMILVDLSVLREPLGVDLLAEFTGISKDDLATALEALIKKKLVVSDGQGYSLANSTLLPSLSSFGLRRSAEIYKRAGIYYKKLADSAAGEQALAFLEKAVNYFALSGSYDSDYQDILIKAERLARLNKKPELIFYVLHLRRILLHGKRTQMQLSTGDRRTQFDDDLFALAKDEATWAFFLRRVPEAIEALQTACEVTGGQSPLVAMRALRDLRMLLRYDGFDDGGENLENIKRSGVLIEDLQKKPDPESEHVKLICWVDEMLLMTALVFFNMKHFEKSEMLNVIQTAINAFEQFGENMSEEDLIELGLLIFLATQKIRTKYGKPLESDVELMRNSIVSGRKIIDQIMSNPHPEPVMGRLVELTRAAADLSVNILGGPYVNDEDLAVADKVTTMHTNHCEGLKDPDLVALSYHARGDFLSETGNLNDALILNERVLKLPVKIASVITSLVNIALLNNLLKNFEPAFVAAKKALQLVKHHRKAQKFADFYGSYIVAAYNEAAEKLGYEDRIEAGDLIA